MTPPLNSASVGPNPAAEDLRGRRRPIAETMPRRFRPEVQALRAIAVLAVVLYHLWPGWFPGGFIGVDVFFVVSGFLITGNMLRELEATGRLSLSGFWANRVRRILPAGLLAIAVTAIVSIWLLPLARLSLVTNHALASVFYVENWLLAHEAVDYLAQSSADSPFQHFWSLAVEEQFYLVWPLIMVMTVLIAGRRSLRNALWIVFGVVTALSFTWSWIAVGLADPSAYFATPTRLWQLSAGALLALVPASSGLPDRVREACAGGSLMIIMVSVVAIRPGMPFPGPLALAPVIAAVLMIVAGPVPPYAGARPRCSWLPRALESWPAQRLGDISYSLYLWHFPPVVMYLAVVGTPPGLAAGIGLAAISIGLSTLSYYFVEQPARRSAWLRRSDSRALLAGGLAMGLAALIALVPILPLIEHERRVARVSTPVADLPGRGAEAFDLNVLPPDADPSFIHGEQTILPDPIGELRLPTMPGYSYQECQASGEDPPPDCHFGPDGAKTHLAVVGDSNAVQYVPALIDIVQKKGWRMTLHTRSECPFNPDMRPRSANNSSCPAANRELLRTLLADQPDIVFTAASSSYTFDGGDGEPPGATGFADYWNLLSDAGIDVLVVRPMPRPRVNPVECVGQHLSDPIECAEDREELVSASVRALYTRALQLAPRALSLDLTDQVCGASRCFAVLGNTLVYRDPAHFTVEFVRTLTGTIEPALSGIR